MQVGPQEDGDADPERQQLLDHHHRARKALVGKRREPEEPVGLVGVPAVAGARAEEQEIDHGLGQRQHREREEDALRPAEAAVPCRIDELRPDEQSAGDEGHVLEVVHARVRGGEVVEARHVPDRHRGRPERQADQRAEHERKQRAKRFERGQRAQDRRRQQEEDERAAHGDDEQRGGRVADQDVLEHVRREQIVVSGRVQRRGDRQDEEREPRAEEERTCPGRMVGAAAAEPHERLNEEERRERRGDQDRRRRLPGRGKVREEHG